MHSNATSKNEVGLTLAGPPCSLFRVTLEI